MRSMSGKKSYSCKFNERYHAASFEIIPGCTLFDGYSGIYTYKKEEGPETEASTHCQADELEVTSRLHKGTVEIFPHQVSITNG